MTHYASPEFWACYRALPADIQALADKSFDLLKVDSRHPSLRLKRVDNYHSVRVGLYYRALGVTVEGGISWFWIGTHAEYEDRWLTRRSSGRAGTRLLLPFLVAARRSP